MQPTGTQIIAELIECSKDLNNKKFLAAVLEIGIKQAGLTLRSLSSHEFSPVGLTVIAVISESHVAIHTYPEAHHASVDIFTCSPNQQKSLKLFSYLRSQLRPKTIKTTILARGKTLDILNQNWITSPTSYGLETKYHIKRKIFEKKFF